ncbi:hypothetical protein L1887_48599 [Cichorium endivia]|nr:hypothetical protein L1887_48599 [Cichorium endivia]
MRRCPQGGEGEGAYHVSDSSAHDGRCCCTRVSGRRGSVGGGVGGKKEKGPAGIEACVCGEDLGWKKPEGGELSRTATPHRHGQGTGTRDWGSPELIADGWTIAWLLLGVAAEAARWMVRRLRKWNGRAQQTWNATRHTAAFFDFSALSPPQLGRPTSFAFRPPLP